MLFLNSCTTKKQEINYPSESAKLYNEILDKLITENFYQCCLGEDYGKIYAKIIADYDNNKIDSAELYENILLLKEKRKKNKDEKCILILDVKFIMKDIKPYLYDILKKSFSQDISDTTEFSYILNDLITFSNLKPEDLSFIDFIEFKLFDKRMKRHFNAQRGIGTIAVSKIYFGVNRDIALLYYEYYNGGKNARGEILLLYKLDNRWTIKGKEIVWIS